MQALTMPAAALPYPGGKGASGAVQQIINLIPPHRCYLEVFVGGGAVFAAKRPAARTVLSDRDPAVAEHWRRSTIGRPDVEVLEGCALQLLSTWPWQGDEFVYVDPPYHPDTRRHKRLYRCELDDGGHQELLRVLRGVPVPWLLSGYRCQLYDDAAAASSWARVDFTAMTRGGARVESLWRNYPAPARLAEYTYVGSTFRDRQNLRRKTARWLSDLEAMPAVEREALLAAMRERFPG